MISKKISSRKDGKSSARDSLRYGEGLKVDRETGKYLDKSHRTRFGGFGLIDDGVYFDQGIDFMSELIDFASIEMQSTCDLNTRVSSANKIAHFVFSYNQDRPSEMVLRDTEDSVLAALGLQDNHFSTFLHNDNGYWHLHMFASRIGKSPPHNGNSLWGDQIARDKVCREIEIRHGLKRDNGMHLINEAGGIVEIPLLERRAKRNEKREVQPVISDRAKTVEVYSGEKSFQAWANDIRLGDRLKHAKSWKDLHEAVAAYNCEIKQKGAGLVVCPVGEAGGMQLSKLGLTKLPAKFGAFQPAQQKHQLGTVTEAYKPAPAQEKAVSHYARWRLARKEFQPVKVERVNAQREAHQLLRNAARTHQRIELARIRAATSVEKDRLAAISVAKMAHVVAQAELMARLAQERQALRAQLAVQGPGSTFRDYLVAEAAKGDDVALGMARRYGAEAATNVHREREADQLQIVAAVKGREYRPAPRLQFSHRIERNGTVVYDFGQGRTVTDSAIARQVQLNAAAAHSPEAIGTALRFATTKFGNTLTLTGSQEFQRLAVETAVAQGLGIRFADPAMEAYRETLAAEQRARRFKSMGPIVVPRIDHLTPRQLTTGVDHVLTHHLRLLDRAYGHQRTSDHLIHADALASRQAAARAGRVHELPNSELDAAWGGSGGVLPHVVQRDVDEQQAREDHNVRRPGPGDSGSRTSNEPGGGPVTVLTSEHARETLPASAWLHNYVKTTGKQLDPARPDSEAVRYRVLYVAPDGVVLNKGRSVALYPLPNSVVLKVGDEVAVGRNAEVVFMPARSKTGPER